MPLASLMLAAHSFLSKALVLQLFTAIFLKSNLTPSIQLNLGLPFFLGKSQVINYVIDNIQGKGKAIPLHAWPGPEGSRFEAPRFQDNLHMKVVRLSVQRTGHLYPPGNIPGTHFC